jgi:hypothetical protein
LNDLHRLAAELVLVLAVVAVVSSVVGLATHRPASRLLVVQLAWVGSLSTVAAVLGLAVLAGGPGPQDPLHLVYGALAVGAMPVAAMFGAGRPERQQLIVSLIAGIVLLILVLRLFQTGG